MLFVMQANNDPDQPQDAPVASDAVDPISEAPAAEPEAAPALDPWEELEAEAAKWKEISLRTAAEMENLR
jgi:molecular chaperone GrpE (heat shock protein)